MAMAAVEPGTRVIRPEPGSCAFYVQRKKRWHHPLAPVNSQKPSLGFARCLWSLEPNIVESTEQDLGNKLIPDLGIPCPYDPKHTCLASIDVTTP